MKWLRISNPGSFDIDSALNMLGASVKMGENPIGMFGSGTKYAIAQACRENIPMKIATDNKVYSVKTESKSFRDVEFQKVVLKTETGKEIKTPMTTAFGSKDWNDSWFIFRELYSNAIDEGSRQIDIVDGIEALDGQTSVFLPYSEFRYVYEYLDNYFTKHEEGIWAGTGCVYRNNVFVGKFDGCKINLNNPEVKINECRVMDLSWTRYTLERQLQYCEAVDVWVEFFKSSDTFLANMNVTINKYENAAAIAVHKALLQVYGDNYCVCPNVNDIVRDVAAMGYTPVVLKGISIQNDNIKNFKSLDNSQSCRDMSEEEVAIFAKIRKSISAFVPDICQPQIKVISEGAAEILGQADMDKSIIYIRGTLFQPSQYNKLVNTIIHEFGHIVTKRGDYDRMFTDFFIQALTNLSM